MINSIILAFLALTPWNITTGLSDVPALLTNSSTKQWRLYSTTEQSGCPPSGNVHSDNTYTFFANGTFEFDHGTVTDDPQCKSDNCCSDFVNLTGTWQLTDGQTHLKVTASHEKGNTNNQLSIVLFDATIEMLDENVLRINQSDSETNTTTIEFRKK